MKKQRHTMVPASYLVLFKDKRVLLARRRNTGYRDGFYSVPAGHKEKSETFSQCMVRETKEEIGIDLQEKNLHLAYIMSWLSDNDETERIDFFFTVEKWRGEIENKEPEKCDNLSWFSVNNLPENIVPSIRFVLENIQKGIT